ncbi:MAG TPA: histidine kinase dimerization/phospho-acceptor domain-containing protein [Draconibacterium sp.]|nr:histidine kinase dimerization/phospho-acceptor domain-containing protein [Draconibacterium sp.]
MKLLNKLTNRYLGWSIVVMVFIGTLIYFTFSHIVSWQLDEKLTENLDSVKEQLEHAPETAFFDPLTVVEKTSPETESITFSDTLIYNEREKEYEDYRQIRTVKNINGEYYRIILRKSKIESEDLLATLAIVTLLGMLILWLILFLVTRKLAKSLWHPFFANLERIRQFSVLSEEALEFENTGIFEFDQLNTVVSGLTSQIISDFQNQKQFSEDVSHELQTPLAIISSRMEGLLEDPALKEHTETLNGIYASVRRLSRLNKAMILLRKIENNQFASDEQTNLTQVATEKLEEFSELITLKNLKLETVSEGDLVVPIPLALAEILINNLLSNSINHTPKGGRIKLQINRQKLVICNSGTKAIPNPEKLFNRFYKGDPSSQSVGLGLAIVKKICDLNYLEIHYRFSEKQHRFEIVSI